MSRPSFLDAIAFRGARETILVSDPRELDVSSRITQRLDSAMNMYRYRLLDRSVLRQRFDAPFLGHFTRRFDDVLICNVGDSFATTLDIGGEGLDAYCFTFMLAGRLRLYQDGAEVMGHASQGIAFRAAPGTQSVSSDLSGRMNFWVKAQRLEHDLEQLLGDKLRRSLKFNLSVDWSHGLAASLHAQIRYLIAESGRKNGITSSPPAIASFLDFMTRTILNGLPNNYSESLSSGRVGAGPAYLHRAEEYMRAHADKPIRMEMVAKAAGCSVRTLESVFQRFRYTTPLSALHAIRLEAVRSELRNPSDASIAEIARRFGFTNASRFAAAYRRKFGEAPPPKILRGVSKNES